MLEQAAEPPLALDAACTGSLRWTIWRRQADFTGYIIDYGTTAECQCSAPFAAAFLWAILALRASHATLSNAQSRRWREFDVVHSQRRSKMSGYARVSREFMLLSGNNA